MSAVPSSCASSGSAFSLCLVFRTTVTNFAFIKHPPQPVLLLSVSSTSLQIYPEEMSNYFTADAEQHGFHCLFFFFLNSPFKMYLFVLQALIALPHDIAQAELWLNSAGL